jgi:cyanophycin synthetase
MPSQPRARPEAELLELRVLDGPNRFFVRPSVKLEFSSPSPGVAESVAREAGDVVRRLYEGLGLPPPRLTGRTSVDGLRALVAFPWRRRTISQAIGSAAARVALGRSGVRRELKSLRALALGPLPSVPSPRIPVVAITGTNGKSTTTRLIAHIASEAGLVTGMTNSDGIFVRGELAEAGDWTGFGGAGRILSEPGMQLAVLETARGGILLRGLGYDHNDVAVVTNVSPDHLGLQGIDTLDELAETKATLVRVTRRDGWVVLNADDPRVWRMRRETKARMYAFSADPESPTVEAALDHGGRAAVVERGWITLRRSGERPVRLARVTELPVTFGGLSRVNVANALAAAAACDALGIEASLIGAGLRSFGRDLNANPGRLNLFERRGILVLIDFAHNEAGLSALIDVCRALVRKPKKGRSRGGTIRLGLGTAGDRTDEMLRNMGELAGRGADEVIIAEKRHYLRGRDLEEMNDLFRDGVRLGGNRGEVPAYETELAALQALLDRSHRGDVAAVMAHVERAEIFTWLTENGFKPVSVERVREIVRGA